MVLNANATARATVITRRIGFSFSPGVGLIRPAPISRPEYPRTARVLRQYVKPRRRPPRAPLAPHQSRPARDTADAVERGGVVGGQSRVQKGARAKGVFPYRSHHLMPMARVLTWPASLPTPCP